MPKAEHFSYTFTDINAMLSEGWTTLAIDSSSSRARITIAPTENPSVIYRIAFSSETVKEAIQEAVKFTETIGAAEWLENRRVTRA